MMNKKMQCKNCKKGFGQFTIKIINKKIVPMYGEFCSISCLKQYHLIKED
jgi:hypothetical protein